jgi:hypothetical protein
LCRFHVAGSLFWQPSWRAVAPAQCHGEEVTVTGLKPDTGYDVRVTHVSPTGVASSSPAGDALFTLTEIDDARQRDADQLLALQARVVAQEEELLR